jgi:hypothetical protein
MLDTTAPSGGTFTVTAGVRQVSLSWSGISDATSGVASYRLVFAPGTSAPSCATGTVLSSGTSTSFLHSSVSTGQTFSYRICALDVAGNISSGLTGKAVVQ